MLKKSKGGINNIYIDNLVEAGYVKRDFTWHLDTENVAKLTKYRLSDNYLRFYLKYIAPAEIQIENGIFAYSSLTALPAWEAIMGLQFENLVVHNRRLIWKILGIDVNDIVMDGPFFQTHTQQRPGCQIDYLIQTRFNTLYLCEIKFSKGLVGTNVIEEVKENENA